MSVDVGEQRVAVLEDDRVAEVYLERLLEKEETSPDSQLEYQQRNLMAFAATEEVPYDSSGRIVMPRAPNHHSSSGR